jgi:hypothetical protein
MDSDVGWYTGTQSPQPGNLWDFWGVMTHELGHAHQAWIACTDGGTGDPCDGAHYDTTNNLAICDLSGAPASFHTMCVSSGIGNSWRLRTLEAHDRDLVESAY